jgi:hypothetical protein
LSQQYPPDRHRATLGIFWNALVLDSLSVGMPLHYLAENVPKRHKTVSLKRLCSQITSMPPNNVLAAFIQSVHRDMIAQQVIECRLYYSTFKLRFSAARLKSAHRVPVFSSRSRLIAF